MLGIQVVDIHSVFQGGPPLVAGVGIEGYDGFLMEERTQIIVAVETLLIMIAYGIALVRRAYPQILVRVGVHAFDAMLRDFKWKTVFLFMYDGVFYVVVKERMILRANQ